MRHGSHPASHPEAGGALPPRCRLLAPGSATAPNNAMNRLKRPLHPMPGFVRQALERRGLMAAYETRPPYQRNDYLGWITRAVSEETQLKRLEQMLAELEQGNVYMKMPWRAAPRR
jgi:hypothetical protein